MNRRNLSFSKLVSYNFNPRTKFNDPKGLGGGGLPDEIHSSLNSFPNNLTLKTQRDHQKGPKRFIIILYLILNTD